MNGEGKKTSHAKGATEKNACSVKSKVMDKGDEERAVLLVHDPALKRGGRAPLPIRNRFNGFLESTSLANR